MLNAHAIGKTNFMREDQHFPRKGRMGLIDEIHLVTQDETLQFYSEACRAKSFKSIPQRTAPTPSLRRI
jgi:hypothetical protein